MGQIHRFRDAASIWSGTGETVYMSAATARQVGAGLTAIADSIDRERFADSAGLTVEFDTSPDISKITKSDPTPPVDHARTLAEAARSLIDEFGGDVPDWLRDTGAVERLAVALDPFERVAGEPPLDVPDWLGDVPVGGTLTREEFDMRPGTFVNVLCMAFDKMLEDVSTRRLAELGVPYDEIMAVGERTQLGTVTELWATVDDCHDEEAKFVRVR